MRICAFDVAYSTPFTKMLPKPVIGPEATPEPEPWMPASWVGPPHEASSQTAAATIVVNLRFMLQTPEGAHVCSLGALISLEGDTRRHPDGSRTSTRTHSRSAWPRARSTRRPLARGMPDPRGRETLGTPATRSSEHGR